MTTFVWIMVALLCIAILNHAYFLGSGKAQTPLSRGERSVVLVADIALLVFGLKVLDVL